MKTLYQACIVTAAIVSSTLIAISPHQAMAHSETDHDKHHKKEHDKKKPDKKAGPPKEYANPIIVKQPPPARPPSNGGVREHPVGVDVSGTAIVRDHRHN